MRGPHVSTTRTRLRTAVRAAGAAALVAVLAACANPLAGNAIVVGEQSVSDTELAAQVDEIRALYLESTQQQPFEQGAVTASNVDRLTRSLLLGAAAAREGIVVTQGQVDDIIVQTVDSQFQGDREAFDLTLAQQQNVPPSQVDSFARDFLIQQKLGEKLAPGGDTAAVSAALVTYLGDLGTELGAEVAPRFGTWVAKDVTLGPVPDDLSTLPGLGE